ncbi:Carcinoembryonic antigen-related cell adhesion molecule 3 [Lemmus lemmus]
MEESSVLLCKGCTPWKGLLLIAFLWNFWHLPTTAHVSIESVPPIVAEGENILLQVHNLPEELQAFTWYKSPSRTQVLKIVEYSRSTNSTTWGHEHSRREMVYANGSLMLQNVIEKDAGLYTLEILNRDFKIEKVDVKIHVSSK